MQRLVVKAGTVGVLYYSESAGAARDHNVLIINEKIIWHGSCFFRFWTGRDNQVIKGKHMQFKALTTAIGALALSLSPGLAGATIVYDTWTTNEGDSGNYILTVTENLVDDVFEVELTVDPWNAEALGLFIDLGNADVGDDTLTNASPAGQVTVVATDTDSNSCGSGCSLNGLSPTLAVPDGQWEWVIRLGAQGFDGIQTFSFDLARNGLSEDDWGLVGARAQQLCDAGEVLPDGSCGGSDKSFSSGAPAPVPLPEPGTLALMAVGLAGIRFAGRAGRALS